MKFAVSAAPQDLPPGLTFDARGALYLCPRGCGFEARLAIPGHCDPTWFNRWGRLRPELDLAMQHRCGQEVSR